MLTFLFCKLRLHFIKLGLFLPVLISNLLASQPERERSLESCRASLEILSGQHYRGFSSSLLIPLGKLLATRHLEYIAKLHVLGETYMREHPTPGLAHMFLTASTAADSLVAHLDEIAVRPNYVRGDIVQGAIETLSLMLSSQPKYIRDAVLIRDGVVMVVPLLERVEKGSFPDRKPLYRPVIVKGHQEIEDSDILAAVFAAWALAGPQNLGRLPERAKIFLKPMAQKRQHNRLDEAKAYESFEVYVRDYLPEVERIHSRYIELISDPEKLESLPLRRNTAAMQSSWAPYLRQLMMEEGNLTMMPYPPKEREINVLQEAGIKTIEDLAKLSVREDRFLEIVAKTGLRPENLRYYISHAIAIHSNRPVLVAEYEDPFKDVDWLVHIDFEDLMERDVKSGVYLFGIQLENARSRKQNRVVKEDFIFAPMGNDPNRVLSQKQVDEGWAQFIRYFIQQFGENFESENFLITVYSHHEQTKFNQQFDIVEAPAENFSTRERSLRYYSSYTSESGRIMGRLIRNRSFFRKYPDIKPEYIFALLDKMIDLLPYIRWNFAFPTHTNSLKYVLNYVMPSTGHVLRYPEGWNGLESIEWAKNAYQTGEEALFERIRIYNEIDIRSNYYIANFIRQNAGRRKNTNLRWRDSDLEVLENSGRVADATRRYQDLSSKSQLLAKIFRKPLSQLSKDELAQLERILDRRPYLQQRQEILKSDQYTKAEKDQILQRLKYEFSNKQRRSLILLFEKIGGYDRNEVDHQVLDYIAEFFLYYRRHELTKKSLHRMIAMERIKDQFREMRVRRSGTLSHRLQVPNDWTNKLKVLIENKYFSDLNVERSDLLSLIQGVYFSKLF